MESALREQLKPGARVRIIQQIPARDHTWTTEIIGTVTQFQQRPTGSWFAHSKGDKLWLDRLVIKKDSGEITTLILDDYTAVEIQSQSGAAPEESHKNESELPM
ncbi:MAG TPA: hypothetical protein VF669_09130 [Tepidisphaeraceae bacterium]|jgi:hypothetical protein